MALNKKFKRSTVRRILDAIPGRRIFGVYRFLPIFFGLGALLEFSMINWTVGETNFYKVYKRRQVEKLVSEENPET